jgi:putative ABC transport system permease protein
MLNHFLKIAFRNLVKNKLASFINLFGLTIGLTGCLLIAFPLAWWGMNRWLSDFAYRTSMDPGIYIIAGVAVLFLSLFTVAFQAIRAARANPVKNLRTE